MQRFHSYAVCKAGVAVALTAGAFISSGPIARSAGEPVVVPLYVEHGPRGDVRLGIDVTIGDKKSRVLVDTGSVGLRVLASSGGTATRRTGRTAGGAYGSGLMLHGVEAHTPLAVGNARGDDVAIELVDSFDCLPGRTCAASNGGTPEMFGELFSGIMGLRLRDAPRGDCCANPLPALSGGVGRSYIVHANVTDPSLILNPDPSSVAKFTMVESALGTSRGCVQIQSAQPSEVCGDVLFDTGSPQMMVTTTGIGHEGPYAPHTAATLSIGTWSHTYEVGPGTPLRLSVVRGDHNGIIVGLAYHQDIDVYYDFSTNRIGLTNR